MLDKLQTCFQDWRTLEELDEADGEAMGKMLMANRSGGLLDMIRTKKASGLGVKLFFEENFAMRALKREVSEPKTTSKLLN